MKKVLIALAIGILPIYSSANDSLNLSLVQMDGVSGEFFIPAPDGMLATGEISNDSHLTVFVYSIVNIENPQLAVSHDDIPLNILPRYYPVRAIAICSDGRLIISEAGWINGYDHRLGYSWDSFWGIRIYSPQDGQVFERTIVDHGFALGPNDATFGSFIVADSLVIFDGSSQMEILSLASFDWLAPDEDLQGDFVPALSFGTNVCCVKIGYLEFISLTDPTNPQLLSRIRFGLPSKMYSLWRQHLYAFGQGNMSRLERIEVYSVADLRHPAHVSRISVSNIDSLANGKFDGAVFVGDLLLIGISAFDSGGMGGIFAYEMMEFDSLRPAGYHRGYQTNQIWDCGSDIAVSYGGEYYSIDWSELTIEQENIINLLFQPDFSYYPNPFNSTLSLKFGAGFTSDTQLHIFDQSGRLQLERILAPNVNSTTWEAYGVSAGTYFVHLNVANRSVVQPVVLVK